MPEQAGYYRQPTLHGDTLVFVCEDDLWSVDAGGGTARRLTVSPGTVSFPRFSPDGRQLAFTGRDDGPAEAYVVDAHGGAAQRLTHLGGEGRTVGWRPDGGAILFASHAGQPFQGAFHLHEAPVDGGPTRVLPYGPARELTRQARGSGVVLGINSGDPARWKRYRGGTAGTLWIDRAGRGKFEPLLRLRGNLASPMWIGSRIYFLSDHEGHGNLYSCTPAGRAVRRHTHHEDYYVRFPSTDGRRIAYHAGADLFLFDVKANEGDRVDVKLRSPRAQRARRFVTAHENVESARLHPKGHSLVCVARGSAHTLPLWAGAPTPRREGNGARTRLARWLPDGKRIVAVSDEQGEEALIIYRADGGGRAKRIRADVGRAVDLEPAPAGRSRVAIANHRNELLVVDLTTGKRDVVETSRYNRIQGFDWSPGGRWLVYGIYLSRTSSSIHLYDTRRRQVHKITRPDFVDFSPSFDPAGKYLYFLSHRVFDPVYDNQYFDLGFPRGVRPYLVPLLKKTPSPFSMAMRTPQAPRATPAEEAEARKKKKKETLRIDLPGIADRVVVFPVEEARYLRVRGGSGSRVFFSSVPVEGSLDQPGWDTTEPPAKAWLEVYNLEQDKLETFLEGMSDFSLSMDAKIVLVRVGNHLRALSASMEAKDISSRDFVGRETGWVDVERLRVPVVPGEEWRQMFREAWRLQRDQFWTRDMSRVDWKGVHDRYLPLVDRVGSRTEFSDLMWEMQGELGTSHCYELGGDYLPSPDWYQGFLGADLAFGGRPARWRIRRIPRGDSWILSALSPLARPGLGIREGDAIVALNGQRVDAKHSPHERLVNQALREIVLTIESRGKRRVVPVRTLESEFDLRYRDWVEANRARVHKETRGKVGYVHVPNMGPRGYSEFHRYFRNEVDREGLIVDVRWNGGGHVSQLLLEKLLRKRVGYDSTRWMDVESYPTDAPMGPMVALTNEYAGSDGDMFSHAFKLYKLGPLIGKRTWGGVIGIWPRHALVDGTITTQPEFGFWFVDVGFDVENYGTDPDIEVDITPQDHAKGKDTQLDRGLVEIKKILRKKKPQVPRMDKRPNLKPPRLPRA